MKQPKAVIVQELNAPVAAEVLAKSIIEIDKAVKAMLNAGLKRETIVVLIHDMSVLAKRDVRLVLDCLDGFKAEWCSK